MGIAEMYGFDGLRLGDPHVAELLQRSVEGQWRMYCAVDELYRRYGAEAASRPSLDFPVMTVLFAHELALLRWQMATNFIDGAVGMYGDQSMLPNDIYQLGDDLCDNARAFSKQAIELRTKLTGQSKVNLIQADSLTTATVTARQYEGLWGMFSAIASAVARNPLVTGDTAVPERYRKLFERDLQTLKGHLEAFRYQEAELRITQIAANRQELVTEAAPRVAEMYKLLQRIQAPYLYGPQYAELRARKPSLDELSVEDPWILTDPRMRQRKERDATAVAQLAELWSSIQDVPKAVQVAKDINELCARRFLRRRMAQGYHVVPWPSQFLVRRSFTYGKDSFLPGELVALYVDRRGEQALVSLRRVGKLTRILDLLGAS